MANQLTVLPLDPNAGGGPTLTNGMRYASAAGGLPARLTHAADLESDINAFHAGPSFDPDNLHFWSTIGVNLKRWVISTMTADLTITLPGGSANALGTWVTSSAVYVSDFGQSKIHEYDLAGNFVRSVTLSGVSTSTLMSVVFMPSQTAKCWALVLNANQLQEFNYPAGTTTGRVITGRCNAIHPSPNGTHFFLADDTHVKKIKDSDLSTVTTWTLSTGAFSTGPNPPGYVWPVTDLTTSFNVSTIQGVYVDSSDNPWVCYATTGYVDKLVSGGGTGAAAVSRRYAYGNGGVAGLGGAVGISNRDRRFHRPIDFTPDGTKVYVMTYGATNDGPCAIRVIDTRTARARWSWTNPYAVAVTVVRMGVPGALRRGYDGTNEYRSTRFYYSTDGGSSRSECGPSDVLSVVLAVGATLTFDAEMTIWGMPPGPAPWIGGAAGEGPTLIVDDGIPARRSLVRFNRGFD